jgi:hypothetical protein
MKFFLVSVFSCVFFLINSEPISDASAVANNSGGMRDLFFDLRSTATNFAVNNGESTSDDKDEKDRKISASALFGGIAQSCVNLGGVVGAQSHHAQQQAACNLAGSVFNLASQLTAKPKPSNSSHSVNPFVEKIVLLTCDMLDALRISPLRPLFISESSVFYQIDQVKSRDEKQSLIRQCLQSKELVQPFLQELFTVLSKFISAQLTKTIDELQSQLPFELEP